MNILTATKAVSILKPTKDDNNNNYLFSTFLSSIFSATSIRSSIKLYGSRLGGSM